MVKRKLKIDSKQMILDLGQKYYGPIHCKSCDFVYIANSKEDEELHRRQHNKLLKPIYIMRWQNERVVHEYSDGRIILILPSDYLKNKDRFIYIRNVVDQDLGTNGFQPINTKKDYSQQLLSQNEKIFLFVYGKYFAGFCLAQDISIAYKINTYKSCANQDVLPNINNKNEISPQTPNTVQCPQSSLFDCQPQPVSVKCGINQIWVAPLYKHKRIASRLLDSVRSNFHYGCTLSKQDLAFTSPTLQGIQFIKAYYENEDFNVYCPVA